MVRHGGLLSDYSDGVDPLRELLTRHMRDWRIVESSERMEVSGWLKSGSVEVTVRGLRRDVVETLQALIATLIQTERV
jgi:hypothetical protein